MTKDLVDAMKDLQSAEVKFNKGEPAPTPAKVVALEPKAEVIPVKPVKTKTGEVKAEPTAKKADGPHKIVEMPKPSKEDRIVELLTNFCVTCGHMDIVDRGNGHVKHYPRPEAWKYLADLCGTYTRVESTHYVGWKNNPCEYRVEATVSLVEKKTDKVLTTVTMCAASDEDFVKNNKLSSAYGLAITRAESRAVRSRFGHYMSVIGYQITPFEELDNYLDIDLEDV